MPHALVVDDDVNFLLGLTEIVSREGFTATSANSVEEARAEIARQMPDVVLADLQLPDGSGLDLLDSREGPDAFEVILITGHATVETAVNALRRGAADYLTKPVDFARIKAVLANLTRTRELKEEIGSLRTELRKLGRFGPIIGASASMQKVYDLISRVAKTDATVLITGETGTGKELVAEAVHQQSRRRREPFLPVNCGAVAPTLIESELFGHERGSFTGAERVHKGYFERSHRGTLFLDEITEMPADLQVKLLRVLETGTVTRIGGSEGIRVDVRVIAATNRVPEDAVAEGKLRQDMLYRLSVFPIALPPLRERQEDVELLADHFLAQLNKQEGTAKTLRPEAREHLAAYEWPGNVRELRNAIQRAYIMAEEEIGPELLPVGAPAAARGEPGLEIRVGMTVADAERLLILATLQGYGGDKKKAADVLRISLKTLYNRIKEYRAGEAPHRED